MVVWEEGQRVVVIERESFSWPSAALAEAVAIASDRSTDLKHNPSMQVRSDSIRFDLIKFDQ